MIAWFSSIQVIQSLLCLGPASLPSDAAELLGFDPQRELSFIRLYERQKPPEKEDAWTVERVEIAGAGGNRFVFGVHFVGSYPADNSVLILYVDSDANSQTGRKGHGCEFMLTLHNRTASVTAFSTFFTMLRVFSMDAAPSVIATAVLLVALAPSSVALLTWVILSSNVLRTICVCVT